MPSISFRVDDLSGAATRALIGVHLADMRDTSPPESVHALGLEALRAPHITFWSAWVDDDLAAIGALSRLDAHRGELKSMRVADRFRGTGVGRAILRHIVAEARASGLHSLWLETGSTAEFLPARRLYESEGFEICPPFASYTEDPFSLFLMREL